MNKKADKLKTNQIKNNTRAYLESKPQIQILTTVRSKNKRPTRISTDPGLTNTLAPPNSTDTKSIIPDMN